MGLLVKQKPNRLLKRDAASCLKYWSLRELADLPNLVSSDTSERLLQCAVERLARQHESVAEWIFSLKHCGGSDSLIVRNASNRLDTLQYVHADTYKLGRQLLENRTLWERFSDPDRHVVNSTFLELRARHANTVETVVDVVADMRRLAIKQGGHSAVLTELQERVDIFLRRRLGIQLLCDHHAELYKGIKPNGCVSVNAPLAVILNDAVVEAQHIVDVHLQTFPETIYPATTDLTFTMVQPWVHHTLVELLKNAMASAVVQMKADKAVVSSPIHIRLETDNNLVIIDIVDRGTGVGSVARAFELGHTSASRKWDRLNEQQSYAAVRAPLSSLGVGLPVSRYMIEHFGGSLILWNNEDGTGCTVRIQLPMDDKILERIPGKLSFAEPMAGPFTLSSSALS